jgi:hypothetical protein
MIDTTPLQAPKGGCTSRENNEWYQGGQFLPSTCLPKGLQRKIVKAAAVTGNVSRLDVTQSQFAATVYATYTGQGGRRVLHSCSDVAEAEAFAHEFLKAKSAWYIEKGFTPHPTELVVPVHTKAG